VRILWSRLRGFLFARQLDRELDRQVQAHVALIAEDLERKGMPPEEARREAIKDFGNVCRVQEEYRERRGLPFMEVLFQDLRFAVRTLLRKPAFSITTLVILALTIGLNTVVFGVVHGVVLRSLPYRDQDRLMTLWQTDPRKGRARDEVAVANFLDWKERQRTFENLAVIEPFSHELIGYGEPESIRSWIVSEGFFEIMGTPPLLGRWFTSEDYRATPQEDYAPGGASVVMISYGLWQRRFGGDPGVVGKTLPLRGRPMTVAGVMPPEFQYPMQRELWSPRLSQKQDRDNRASSYLLVVGRLKHRVNVDQARNDMRRIAAELEREYPRTNQGSTVLVVPIATHLTGEVRPALWILFGAVTILLLAGCANVGGLVLARGVERGHELAVRSAIGASSKRLIRQLMTETGLLAMCGGIAGIVVAYWGILLVRSLPPSQIPRIESVHISGAVLIFSCVLSAVTALGCGLLPAIKMVREERTESLKSSGRSLPASPRQRVRRILVAAQIAMAMVLLTGASLLTRSLVSLLMVDPGFRPDRLISLEAHVYARARTPQERVAYFRQTIESLSNTPGVIAAAAVSALPFHDNAIDIETPIQPLGEAEVAVHERPTAYMTTITPVYFKLMRIPLQQGRFFSDADGPDARRVAIINESMARRFFPGRDPIGKRILIGRGMNHQREIVGVVGDTLRTGLDDSPRPEFFLPQAQSGMGSMTFIVRTTTEPWVTLPAIKEAIWSVKSGQPFAKIAEVEELMAATHSERRFHLSLIGLFAGLALLLAAVALFGLISYTASQRRGEIGLRMALGASAKDILRLIVGEGVGMAAWGVVMGLAGALMVGRVLRTMLFGVTQYDSFTFAVIPLVLFAVAVSASAFPAWRAARVDASRALRAE